MVETEKIYGILKEYWGYDTFRPKQLEIIASALEGRDTLGILPTGGGKSLTFQIPTLLSDGLALVITPLIALMKDQVSKLQKRGIKALAIHAGMTRREVDTAMNNAAYGGVKFLYVSPERLGTSIFLSWLDSLEICYIVVDEAHCISQWGYDFRPDYLQIAKIREKTYAPVIALTATATPEVAVDIMEKLRFSRHNLIKSSFERPNLAYRCVRTTDKRGGILDVCQGTPGSGIVYVRSRKITEELSSFLRAAGISASHYHAGLSTDERNKRQQDWIDDKIRVMVCTNAFGMGIDKPDVRFVLHYGLPDSIESYFQEAGRAGRDGKDSAATLFWSEEDCKRLRQLHTISFPSLEYIEDIYHKMHAFFGVAYEQGEGKQLRLNLKQFCSYFKLNQAQAYYAMKYLDRCGQWTMMEEVDIPTRVMVRVDRSDLYDIKLPETIMDNVLEVLMRRYEGLFSFPVVIDETYVSKQCGISVSQLRQTLYQLALQHVILYIPCAVSDVIYLHHNRLHPKDVNLLPELYEKLAETSLKRTESIIEYVCEDSKCRSRHLLEYFGQNESSDCGKCDVCLRSGESSSALAGNEYCDMPDIGKLREAIDSGDFPPLEI